MGGHVLRETTSRGLCGLGCPSRTSDRGGEGDCVKEGVGGEGKCQRERALERLRYYRPYAPIWDNELGRIFVARLVFGFVTRRIWFTRVEIKLILSKLHGIAQLSARRLLVLRHGPSARQPGFAMVADYDPSVHAPKLRWYVAFLATPIAAQVPAARHILAMEAPTPPRDPGEFVCTQTTAQVPLGKQHPLPDLRSHAVSFRPRTLL
jgi:hypothetical protein